MEDKDKAKLSLDVLKSIDKSYSPKLNIEAKTTSIDLTSSMEDLITKANELING
jgi:hypothetical protein